MRIFILLSLLCTSAQADMLRVAVIDTGLDITDTRLSAHLCDNGHIDYTGEGLQDDLGHGTHVTGLIEKYAEDSNYCLVILKYYGNGASRRGGEDFVPALREAISQHVNIVNLSSAGKNPSDYE
jgi:hypothetical protein